MGWIHTQHYAIFAPFKQAKLFRRNCRFVNDRAQQSGRERIERALIHLKRSRRYLSQSLLGPAIS
jgi:hypothetical protein